MLKQHPSTALAKAVKAHRYLTALTFAILLAATPAAAVDLDELTVVTLARDGSWGVATAGSTGLAIAGAVRDCRAMAGVADDCGAQTTTTRGGWAIAALCGDRKILVAAKTRNDAEQRALDREIEIRLLDPAMPPCRRILMVDPKGAVLVSQAASAPQIEAQRDRASAK